jgi:hypothetical protein
VSPDLEDRVVSTEDQDLGERDSDEDDFPPSERNIHTQSYDLSLHTLREQWDDGTLILPEFQREYVWDGAKASRLIESLLLNIPIPPLFLAETEDAKYEIVDGQQRVTSIARYLNNEFALSGLRISREMKGLRFHKLPEREQRFLRTRVIRAIVITVESSPTMKFEVFERLNTGGLALNAQEIRNAIYSGGLNTLLKDLERDASFRKCLGSTKPRKRMVDRELVLRFLGLHERLEDYRPPLVRFLNEYMRDHRNPKPVWLNERATTFSDTIRFVAKVLGQSAFRVIDSSGVPIERNINRAIFDAQMLTFSVADKAAAVKRRKQVVAELGLLFESDELEDTIRRATGDRSRTFERIREMAGAVERAGVTVDLKLLARSL